ncbi:MAG: alpha/beta hydrolase [Desulfobacteraceae bacterium]|nr:alpha/beta hydrolase [Desulfobacteraceae bacterium]
MPNVTADGIQIEYDTFGDSSLPPLLLIMGLGMQMIAWDEDFCKKLVEKGLYVIRFDNRDVGLSTKFEEAGLAHGNRKPHLASVTAPTLVIHGVEDPLVPVEHGKDTAEAIPGAEILLIDGMGHGLPKEAWSQIVDAIAKHTSKATT